MANHDMEEVFKAERTRKVTKICGFPRGFIEQSYCSTSNIAEDVRKKAYGVSH